MVREELRLNVGRVSDLLRRHSLRDMMCACTCRSPAVLRPTCACARKREWVSPHRDFCRVSQKQVTHCTKKGEMNCSVSQMQLAPTQHSVSQKQLGGELRRLTKATAASHKSIWSELRRLTKATQLAFVHCLQCMQTYILGVAAEAAHTSAPDSNPTVDSICAMRTCSSTGYKPLRSGTYGTAAAAPLALELFGVLIEQLLYARPVAVAVDIDEAAAPKEFRGPAS